MSAVWALGLAACAATGCTERNLYSRVGQEPPLADKVAVTGVLCTDDPATRRFPVKIMFIVDGGGPMRQAAAFGEHVFAMEQVVSQFLPIANVFVGVIRYDTGARTLISEQRGRTTSGFTRDGARIDAALADLRTGGGARDFASALSLANSLITGDAFQEDLGPLSRTKYVVVHITSGSPAPAILDDRCDGLFDEPPASCELAFLENFVRRLREDLEELGAAEFAFHTVHLETPVQGAPCDPTVGAGSCTGNGLACIQVGVRPDLGRCVQLCDPNAPLCDADPNRPNCSQVVLQNMTTVNLCTSGETACFDGIDNDDDGDDRDCTDPDYPYGCNGNNGCEADCRSQCRMERIGEAMARAGGGRYERFFTADQINLSRIDFRSTQRLFVLKEFLVTNQNAIATEAGFLPDTDADGLPDAMEDRLGWVDPNDPTRSAALVPDFDSDFYNDKLEHILRPLGLDPVVPNVLPDCDDPAVDTDRDGLRDCEEKLLGTDRTLFDTDADGFPDQVEFRAGTNPLFNDTLDDLDIDGITNAREIRAHTDVTANDAKVRAELSYRYRTIDLGTTNDQRTCYDVRVTNVTLVDTRDRGFGPGNNDIIIYFGQVPDGDLEGFGIFDAAQIRVQYFPPDRRIPDTPIFDLREGDFVSFAQ